MCFVIENDMSIRIHKNLILIKRRRDVIRNEVLLTWLPIGRK